MKRHKRLYTCYTSLYPEKVKAEGAPVGSKREVRAWMKGKYGALPGYGEAELMHAAAFFYEGDCTEYQLPDDVSVYLAEALEE